MDPSRNLLFGVLALRAGLIDADAFAQACHRWFRRQETPLADVLRERAGLTATDQEHVAYFVERAVARHGGDATAALRILADDTVWRALADVNDADLRRWLGTVLPGAEWLHREERPPRRGLVGVGIALLVLLGLVGIGGLLTLVSGVFWVRQAREQEMMAVMMAEEARAREMAERARAEANFQAARQAADEALTRTADELRRMTDEVLLKETGAKLDVVRRKLLEDAAKFYEERTKEPVDNPGSKRELARAYRRLGLIHERLGQDEEARNACGQAATLLREQVAEAPQNPEPRQALAATLVQQGRLHKMKDPALAAKSLREATELYRQLLQDSPAKAENREGLAEALLELSRSLQEERRPDEAEKALRQAVDLLQKLAAEFPAKHEYRDRLDEARKRLAELRPGDKGN
jgi:tetratricopeptide (TPR) repeat protein